MSHFTKLGLPIALGLVAAGMNMAASSSRHTPFDCVALDHDLDNEAAIQEKDLVKVSVSGDFDELSGSFLGWNDRALLYGRTLPRPLKKGDVLLLRDAKPHENLLPVQQGEQPMSVSIGQMTVVPEFIQVGQYVSFFVGKEKDETLEFDSGFQGQDDRVASRIGPFRVLAVGTRTTVMAEGKKRNERTLTIAARTSSDGELDRHSDSLLAALKGFDGIELLGVTLNQSPASHQ